MAQRIAFFLPHFGHGGAEGVVLRLLQHIDRSRFQPLLILQSRRGEFLASVPEDVPILALRHRRPPRCIPELARLFAREDIALSVTVNNATNLYAIAAATICRSKVATFVTEHTPLSSFLSEAKASRLRLFAIRRLYRRATLTGGPLEQIGTDIARLLGGGAPPFVRLPNPVVDAAKRLRPLPEVARQIVSVGRLAPEKRFDLLIDAFALLHRRTPDATLTIHGEGSERPALEARIRQLGLEGVVRLPGYTSDLDAVHRRADLFVCTSRREGLGNAIIEAMARGVPVVSVDCPFGPRSLLKDGAAGRLVTDHAPEAIAAAMAETLASLPERQRITEAALIEAQGFEIPVAVRAYEAAFDQAIARARSSRA